MKSRSPDAHTEPSAPERRRLDWTDDSGQIGGIEVLPFGLLIFVLGSLLIANAWAVIDTKLAVNAATREGVRTFVESPNAIAGSQASNRVAREAITGHGRDPVKLTVDAPSYESGQGFVRCAPVTISASYPVPAITLPWIGGFGEAFQVRSSHTELIDPYRSGVEAAGSC